MALAADIAGRIDAGALVSGLVSALGEHGSALGAIAVPDTAEGTGAITDAAGAFDAGGLAPAIAGLAAQGAAGLATLVPGGQVLGTLSQALTLVEQLSGGDLRADVEALVAQLSAELDGSREGGTIGTLMRLSQLLATAPQGGTLAALLQSVLGSAGVTLPAGVRDMAGVLPAVDALVRSVGGLMMLESVLSESQRLTEIMSHRLDAGAVRRDIDATLGLFGPALATRIAGTDPADDAALRGLALTLSAGADRIAALQQSLASGMGLGEATLAYLDVGRVQDEVAAAAALLRGIDLDPLGRQLRNALGGLAPLMAMDFTRQPAQSLDGLLSQAEAQVAGLAAQITAWNPADLVAPLTQGIDKLTAPLANLSQTIAEAESAMRAALQRVRQVVVDLPVRDLAGAITTLLEPVTRAIELITALVADVAAALATAADTALEALGQVEGVVDGFKDELQALFADARQFVEGLNLDSIAGTLAQRIGDFTQAVQQVQLKPYFDTAVDAIGSATDVVAAVPFDMLPDSMKGDVDAVVQPIKRTDLAAFEAQIEALVGIGADGSFTPRADLEAAIAEIQQKFDALIATLREHDPEQYLVQLDERLGELAEQIRGITPAVTLQPVQDAIDQVKGAIAGFDLRAQLAPLQQVFDDALQALQQYSPAQLVAPLQERVLAARQAVVDTIRLDDWAPALDSVQQRAEQVLALIDPARLEGQLAALLGEARALTAKMPDTSPQWLGTVVAAMYRGSLARIHPGAFAAVQGWIDAGAGAAALTARSGAIADAVARTHAAVSGIDTAALAGQLAAQLQPVRSALASLQAAVPAPSPQREALALLLQRLDVQGDFAALAASQARYLGQLQAALPLGATLRSTGLSEVDNVLGQLHQAFAPLRALLDTLRSFLRAAGVPAVEGGVARMLDAVFDVAPPARLAGLTAPLFVALRERVLALIAAVITPLKTGIARLQALIAAVDLAPLQQALDEVFQQALAELQALSPATLLAAPLAAVDTLQASVAAFNPLQDVLEVLDALRDTVARVLAKLSAQTLLADPVAIYREIVDALDTLNVQALMTPVLDLLDTIAKDVDTGLDDTVTAFRRLQDALPA